MTESLIGRISELLLIKQSASVSETQASVSNLSDRLAAASGITLAPPAVAPFAKDISPAVGALAAALHVVAGANPARAPRWQEVAAEAGQIFLDGGWGENVNGDELPFRMAAAMRSVDRETSTAVRQHLPSFKSVTDHHIGNTGKWGPFQGGAPWTSFRFLAHTAGGACAMIGEKQISSAIRTLILAADLGDTDASACGTMVLDARFERLFHKAEIKKEGATLSLDCLSPRRGRDGLSISLFVRVRDEGWRKRAQEADIPVGNCQIEINLEEAMY